jgi:uncharacterized membrane protein YcaP (DUF421 family)
MFFDTWADLGRVLLTGVLGYIGLVLLLRVSGKRTLSKMNAFDFIVTVAIGSALANMILNSSVAYLEGILAFAVLIGLQFVIAWLSVRSEVVTRLVKSEPTLLVYQGRFLRDAMRRERVIEAEIYAALRDQGMASIEQVEAVVLETQGELSVISASAEGRDRQLEHVSRVQPDEQA